MKIVIVKHENCEQKFLFEVPESKSVCAGDLVLVNTRYGETYATCLCDSFYIDESKKEHQNILAAFGTTKVTASVIGICYIDRWDKQNDGVDIH